MPIKLIPFFVSHSEQCDKKISLHERNRQQTTSTREWLLHFYGHHMNQVFNSIHYKNKNQRNNSYVYTGLIEIKQFVF